MTEFIGCCAIAGNPRRKGDCCDKRAMVVVGEYPLCTYHLGSLVAHGDIYIMSHDQMYSIKIPQPPGIYRIPDVQRKIHAKYRKFTPEQREAYNARRRVTAAAKKGIILDIGGYRTYPRDKRRETHDKQ